MFYMNASGCFFLSGILHVISLDSVFFFRSYIPFFSIVAIFCYLQSVIPKTPGHGYQASAIPCFCHLHLSCTNMIFWLLSAVYLCTNAINIFPTLASKSLMKILNEIEARIDLWETHLNTSCQADVESLIPKWKNNLYWLIYWMSLFFIFTDCKWEDHFKMNIPVFIKKLWWEILDYHFSLEMKENAWQCML